MDSMKRGDHFRSARRVFGLVQELQVLVCMPFAGAAAFRSVAVSYRRLSIYHYRYVPP